MKVSPRLVQILGYLASNRGDVVAKDDLLDRFWPDLHVTPNTIDRAITRLRRAPEDPHAPRFIEIVPGRGYRFVVDASGAPTRRALTEPVVHTRRLAGGATPATARILR